MGKRVRFYLISLIVGFFLSGSLNLGEFFQKLAIPFGHAVYLLGGLEFAFGHIPLGPLGEPLGDLLDTADGIFGIVSAKTVFILAVSAEIIRIAALSGSSVLRIFVIKSTKLESTLQTGRVSVEFGTPVKGHFVIQIVGDPFVGKFIEFVQSLERVSWGDLFLGGG